jgi:molybdate transport system substrate-binding protein
MSKFLQKGRMISFLPFFRTLACALVAASLAAPVAAADIRVLSAGAIEPGLKAAAAVFEQQTGHAARIEFNTALELRKRIDGNEAFDVVIAPPAVMAVFAAAGKLGETQASLGRVGMGVAVRQGAPVPDISSAEALKRSVVEAESLVFNRASTGVYLEGLLKKMEIYSQLEPKITRYPDGAMVMEHLIKGKGREIGFGAMTEILLYRQKGLKLVGSLPAEVQNYTAYTAAPLASGAQQALARQFVTFLAGPVGKPLFVSAGVTD